MLNQSTKEIVHFLHIGKTGGSAIKAVLNNNLETLKYIIKVHKHNVSIKDIPVGEKIVFFLRDPISRFVSGFYSRQRKGRPRHNIEWTALEKEVFENFPTPNALALAFSNTMGIEKYLFAKQAMNSIGHLSHYNYWYIDFPYFKSRQNDILFIGFQESLESDFLDLKKILKIPLEEKLPIDDIGAHRNIKGLDKDIDKNAMLTLIDWYKEDIAFVKLCQKIMDSK